MKSMEEMMAAAQQAAETIQKQMNEMQVKLDSIEVEGSAGGGLVKVRASAKGRILGASIVGAHAGGVEQRGGTVVREGDGAVELTLGDRHGAVVADHLGGRVEKAPADRKRTGRSPCGGSA